jgi:hypothetical protein
VRGIELLPDHVGLARRASAGSRGLRAEKTLGPAGGCDYQYSVCLSDLRRAPPWPAFIRPTSVAFQEKLIEDYIDASLRNPIPERLGQRSDSLSVGYALMSIADEQSGHDVHMEAQSRRIGNVATVAASLGDFRAAVSRGAFRRLGLRLRHQVFDRCRKTFGECSKNCTSRVLKK